MRNFIGKQSWDAVFSGGISRFNTSAFAPPTNLVKFWFDAKNCVALFFFAFSMLACLGPIGDILKLGQVIDISKSAKQCNIGQAATDAVRLALTKGSRPEIIDALRPLLRSGKIDAKFLETMYDSGFLKSKNPYGTFERFIKNGVSDFPGTGVAHVNGSTIRHHDFPRQFEREFIMAGYDPDTVGRAIAKNIHNSAEGLHARKGWPSHGGAWNYQWHHFFRNEKTGPHFNVNNPENSLKSFLDLLRSSNNPADWPFQP